MPADRPPIAKHHPRRLSAEAEAQIVELRRHTGWGAQSLSGALGRPSSTIWWDEVAVRLDPNLGHRLRFALVRGDLADHGLDAPTMI
jgi:hypothetical protein